MKNLFEKLVFERKDGNYIAILPTRTKHYNNRVHTSAMLTPVQASLKKNEAYTNKNFLDKRKRMKPQFQINNLIRVADLKRTF